MKFKHMLLFTLISCRPTEKHLIIPDLDEGLSDGKTDLAFTDHKPHKTKVKVLDGLRDVKVPSAEFTSDCSVVVHIWKSLHGETSLSPSSVSPIGCCDDQNSDIRGVRCSEDIGAVIALEWSSWGKWNGKLAGYLPPEIGKLRSLRTLYD